MPAAQAGEMAPKHCGIPCLSLRDFTLDSASTRAKRQVVDQTEVLYWIGPPVLACLRRYPPRDVLRDFARAAR
jgi:hypothetical protein